MIIDDDLKARMQAASSDLDRGLDDQAHAGLRAMRRRLHRRNNALSLAVLLVVAFVAGIAVLTARPPAPSAVTSEGSWATTTAVPLPPGGIPAGADNERYAFLWTGASLTTGADARGPIVGETGGPGGERRAVRLDDSARAALFDRVRGTWSRLPAPPARGGLTDVAVMVDSYAVVVGADPVTGAVRALVYRDDEGWTVVRAPFVDESSVAVATDGDVVFAVAGRPDVSPAAAVLDPRRKQWRDLPDPPLTARTGASVVWTGTDVIVWGGSQAERNAADGATYSPASGRWRPIVDAPQPRAHHASVWLDRRMVVVGGQVGPLPATDALVYDPGADAWSVIPGPPAGPHVDATVVPTPRGLLVAGGAETAGAASTDAALLDVSAAVWQEIADMPEPGRCDAAGVTTDQDTVLVWGGTRTCGDMGAPTVVPGALLGLE